MQAFFEDHETNELIYCHVTLIRYEEKRVCESVTHPSRLAIQSLVLFCATMETHKWLRSSCRRQTPLFLRASHVSIIDIPFSNPAHNLSSLPYIIWLGVAPSAQILKRFLFAFASFLGLIYSKHYKREGCLNSVEVVFTRE